MRYTMNFPLPSFYKIRLIAFILAFSIFFFTSFVRWSFAGAPAVGDVLYNPNDHQNYKITQYFATSYKCNQADPEGPFFNNIISMTYTEYHEPTAEHSCSGSYIDHIDFSS